MRKRPVYPAGEPLPPYPSREYDLAHAAHLLGIVASWKRAACLGNPRFTRAECVREACRYERRRVALLTGLLKG